MQFKPKFLMVNAEQWGAPVHVKDEFDYQLAFGITWKGNLKKYFIGETDIEIQEGDWIVQGCKYPVSDNIFREIFEEIK